MACRAVSCSLGSFHHLKHLAALQHAAAARWEPTVPLLSWATQSWTIPVTSLATRKKTIIWTSLANARTPTNVHYLGSEATIDVIIFKIVPYLVLMSCLCPITQLFLNYEFLDTPFQAVTAVPNQETICVNIWCDCSKVLFSSIAVAISQWNKDPFYIPWETWAEWLMLC